DRADRVVYAYAGAAGWRDGTRSAAVGFALAAGNTQPEGVADPPAPVTPTSSGTEVWLAFPGNAELVPPSEQKPEDHLLYIAGYVATAGVVEVPGLGFSTTFSVTPGQVTTVALPAEVEIKSSSLVEQKGIHVTAQAPVTVYGLSFQQFSSDAYLGLPVGTL